MQNPIKGKITRLKRVKRHIEGKNSYKEYIYEFSTDGEESTIELFEEVAASKESKLYVGMIEEVYYNNKTNRYESMKELKKKLIENVIGFVLFFIVEVLGWIFLMAI